MDVEGEGEGGRYRISRLIAGEGHNLLLTVDGKVFTWGKGFFGRLGNGKTADEPLPTEILFGIHVAPHRQPSIIDIAAGSYHSLALADDGTVWSWGYNFYGQLGYESIDDSIPNHISSWDGLGAAESNKDDVEIHPYDPNKSLGMSKIVHVAAGGMMSCAISKDGRLWMWGNIPVQMDESTEEPAVVSICEVPRPVAGLYGLNVVKVACGYEHVLALVDAQEIQQYACYSWGNNNHGQLGLGDRECRSTPQVVAALDEKIVGKLSDVSCGAYHTAILTHSYRGIHERKSMCWTFGMGDNGQLGQGNSQSLCLPQIVEGLPEGERILAVSCGLFHMGVVTESGEAWTWGMECGLGLCLGIGPAGGGGDYLSPVRVMENTNFGKEIACGAAHTVVSTNDGLAIFAWGRGQNGILGTGQSNDCLIPCPVIWPPAERKEAADVNSVSGEVNELLKGTPAEEGSRQELMAAQKEISALRDELASVKEQVSVLRAALYGSLGSNNTHGTWALFQEWDKTIGAAKYDELVQLNNFYRQAHNRVEEVLLERKVERLCKQYMGIPNIIK